MTTNDKPTPSDIAAAADVVGCSPRIIQAMIAVESRGLGFEFDFPVCLVEPHIIWEFATPLERQKLEPLGLAYPNWGAQPYGPYSAQPAKFKRIAALTNVHLAVYGTSFGVLQVMGENYLHTSAGSPQEFFEGMSRDCATQLKYAAHFMMAKNMHADLCMLRFSEIALKWNGTGAFNQYAHKLENAYYAIGE